MATLTLRRVSKRYTTFEAIKGVDLDINDHEFVVFVGPSGCGKSTLLRMIAGLEEISGGDLMIDGKRVNDVGPADRGLAMVFQSYALYPHMTVAQNMGFSLRLAGAPKAERDRKVREAAAILQLEPLLGRKPKELSGGQRQRVAIGRAIVRHPKAFLFDEPLSNLDAALRVQMRIELRRLHDSLDATMIYVTHDQVEAMTMADRIVVLNAGRIEQVGTPLELYRDPANLFVAGFIGSPHMNLLPARVDRADSEGAYVRLPGGSVVRAPALGAQARTDVTFGVRPEHVHVGNQGPVTGRVSVAERLGGLTFLHVDIGEDRELVVQSAGHDPTQVGETVRLSFDTPDCHLFSSSGAAMRRTAEAERLAVA